MITPFIILTVIVILGILAMLTLRKYISGIFKKLLLYIIAIGYAPILTQQMASVVGTFFFWSGLFLVYLVSINACVEILDYNMGLEE